MSNRDNVVTQAIFGGFGGFLASIVIICAFVCLAQEEKKNERLTHDLAVCQARQVEL